jgi:phosphohistidine phosphatase
MRVYLVQHAESKSKEEDPERSLTDEGLQNIRKVARYAADHLNIAVKEILHSGKLRARRTAEVLADHLNLPGGIKAVDGLEPMADPLVWAERIAKASDDIMLVGHLPHLARLSSFLLCGTDDREIISFQNAGIVSLAADATSGWRVLWIITPLII